MRNYNSDYRIDVDMLRNTLFGTSKLPKDACGVYHDVNVFRKYPKEVIFIGTVTVVKQQSMNPNASGHRVFVDCPSCKKMIPAGRLHQHIGTGTCQ